MAVEDGRFILYDSAMRWAVMVVECGRREFGCRVMGRSCGRKITRRNRIQAQVQGTQFVSELSLAEVSRAQDLVSLSLDPSSLKETCRIYAYNMSVYLSTKIIDAEDGIERTNHSHSAIRIMTLDVTHLQILPLMLATPP